MIGPLTAAQRMEKVLKYLQKKRLKSQMKKYCYKCRKQVAEKRLRIKGRFVTKEQAFEILGISSDELRSNEIIQKLLENHCAMGGTLQPMLQLNSLVESEGSSKQIKIRNFQALIDDNYNHNSHSAASKMSSFLSKEGKDLCPIMSSAETSSEVASTDSLSLNQQPVEELLRHIQLNLRISTTKTLDHNQQYHVAKVLIQHYTSSSESGLMSGSMFPFDESLKLRLSNLRLEGYVQPLFKVEKTIDPKRL